jgi:predicted HicB family RNase H-like nuclease
LKELIENAAGTTGESVNAWVVEALGKRARTSRRPGRNYSESFDL